MNVKYCRNCKSSNLINLFSLGRLSFTGKFPRNRKQNIPKKEIALVICNYCKLVQLNKNFDLNYMYNQDYGYRTGINSTMTNHVKYLVKELEKKIKLKKKDVVLDIASNDATLLNFYSKNLVKVGIDPLVRKYKNYYKNIDYSYSKFFSKNILNKRILKKKIKCITALSVFYDINDPNNFLKEISEIIDKRSGIFILELTDLLSIIQNNLFDTICHEHITYYSAAVLKNILNNNNLKLFDLKKNNINGGSLRFYIAHKEAKYKINNSSINKILSEENFYKLSSVSTFKVFFKLIMKIKNKLINYLDNLIEDNKIIHGYGASTKGNVLLQFFGINQKYLKFIAERNPNKYNLFTPGTKIKIISENYSRLMKPDYYLVLPWHFKSEILRREKKIIKQGTKFIFPLPKMSIY